MSATKEKELKEDVKQETVKAPSPAAEPQVTVLRSEFDAFIMDRMKSQPKTLEEVELRVVERPKEGKHQLSLPDSLEPYTKKYAFCWIFRHKKAIDEACSQYHWVLCNKTYFPDVAEEAPHVFSANGSIELGDQILAFRSRKVDDEMRRMPGIESTEKIQRRKEAHTNDPAFYIPESDEFETDPRTGKRVKVPIVGA